LAEDLIEQHIVRQSLGHGRQAIWPGGQASDVECGVDAAWVWGSQEPLPLVALGQALAQEALDLSGEGDRDRVDDEGGRRGLGAE